MTGMLMLKRCCQWVILVICLLAGSMIAIASGEKEDPAHQDRKKSQSGILQDGIPPEIAHLCESASYAYYQLGNLQVADSLCGVAIKLADLTYRADIILYAVNHYLSMNELGYDLEKAIRYAEKAEGLVYQVESREIAWMTYIQLAGVYLDKYHFDKALSFSYKALSTAESMNDPLLKARSFLRIGSTLQQNNQTIEGFRYFLNALTIAESNKDKGLLKECYKSLSHFYNLSKGYEKAIKYKMKEIDLILAEKPVDSMALVWAWCHLEEINVNFNNQVHDEKLCELVSFAVRHRNTYLKQYVLALFRSYLVGDNRFERLRELYEVKYPEEFQYLSVNQPSVFYRLKAFFYELDEKYDSAFYSYQQAEELTRNNPNKVLISSMYIRFGEFLQRRGRVPEATDKFRLAFNFAQEANYLEYAFKSSAVLVELLSSQAKYEEALFYSEKNRAIADSIIQMNRKDEMLTLEIQNTEQLREMSLKEELQATQRRNNLQYSMMLLAIIGLFLLLLLLGSVRVSPGMIHLLGFISFVFLFEFIILLADNYIHHITHGEPLKVLGIKIVLIAILLPFHHWIEKRVTRYLVHKKLFTLRKASIRNFFRQLKMTAKEIWAKWD